MRLLLDTHAFLWAISRPKKLGTAARKLVEDPANELCVSAASAWEIATKHRIGKLPDARTIIDGWSSHVGRLGAEEIPVSVAHALRAGSLDWDHRDPFDRMLAAQALIEGVALVTNDPALVSLGALATRW